MPSQDQGAPRIASRPMHDDPLHDLQLRRDLEIINECIARELGPLPALGLPVQTKRKPELPKHVRPTLETIAMTMPPEVPTTTLSNGLPAPPVPQRLRELLKDYPELIQTLQDDLNKVMSTRSPGIDVFDRAIWMLEGALGLFISQAREELRTAQAGGDAEAIVRAEIKERLMFRASSRNNGLQNLDELWDYIQRHKDVLK